MLQLFSDLAVAFCVMVTMFQNMFLFFTLKLLNRADGKWQPGSCVSSVCIVSLQSSPADANKQIKTQSLLSFPKFALNIGV